MMNDRGEYTCEEPGVLTLVWDNTYSILTSREVTLRIGVKRNNRRRVWCIDPKQEVKEVKSEEEVKTEEMKSETDKEGEVKTEEVKEEEKPEESKEVKTEELISEESAILESTQENPVQADSETITLTTEEQ